MAVTSMYLLKTSLYVIGPAIAHNSTFHPFMILILLKKIITYFKIT